MHTPPAHVADALGKEHRVPQPPQFTADVRTSVSQPLPSFPSQLPKPAEHPATAHAPPLHSGDAFGSEQARPQLPQFVTLVFRLVSHPSAVGSQSPKLGLHTIEHIPIAHDGRPLLLEHDPPQRPQCVGESIRLVSQVSFASQSPRPDEHMLVRQAPATHTAERPIGVGHALAQRPQ